MYDYSTLKKLATTNPETCLAYLFCIEDFWLSKDFNEILNLAIANLD